MGLLEGAISSLSCLSPAKAATLNLKLGFSTPSGTVNFKLKKPCLRIQRPGRRITYPVDGICYLRVYIYVIFKPELCRLARAGRLPSSTVAEDAGP